MPGKTASPNPIENRKYLLIAKQGKRAIPKYMYILRSIYHCQGRTAIPNSVMKDDQDKTAIPIPNLSSFQHRPPKPKRDSHGGKGKIQQSKSMPLSLQIGTPPDNMSPPVVCFENHNSTFLIEKKSTRTIAAPQLDTPHGNNERQHTIASEFQSTMGPTRLLKY